MIFQGIPESLKRVLSDNSTTILTAGGVVGTVATAVLTGRATLKAAEIIQQEKFEFDPKTKEVLVHELSKTDQVKLVWPQYVLPVATCAFTVSSIIMANRMSAQKAAALAAAYGLSEKQFREYKDKVKEKLTPNKEQSIKDELAQDRVNQTPGSNQVIIVEGKVLCFDEATGRYFDSTMEEIKRAVNRTNEEILHHDSVNASFFYDLLGLPPTTWSDDVGWNTDNMLDVRYSTVLAHNQKPCITIDFAYLPHAGYHRRTY